VSAPSRTGLGAAGFIGGVALGLVVWGMQVQRSRRELFSRSMVRRLAALGYLAGQPSAETRRLLADYLNWETQPILRRRGQILLRRMEAYLD
jgi:hypothetical protein